jgi:hypothetical protein
MAFHSAGSATQQAALLLRSSIDEHIQGFNFKMQRREIGSRRTEILAVIRFLTDHPGSLADVIFSFFSHSTAHITPSPAGDAAALIRPTPRPSFRAAALPFVLHPKFRLSIRFFAAAADAFFTDDDAHDAFDTI